MFSKGQDRTPWHSQYLGCQNEPVQNERKQNKREDKNMAPFQSPVIFIGIFLCADPCLEAILG